MPEVSAAELVSFMTVLVLSVAFHEMAHAWLADRFGDGTPREHGRMTLNPFKHVHPILTIALPAYMYWTSRSFMFMAMTPVSPRRMRDPRLHGMLTALGGPAASLLLGIVCFLGMIAFIVAVGGVRRDSAPGTLRTLELLMTAIELNVFGAFFNLVPIPPLDGAALLEFALPREWLPAWYGFRSKAWILFALLVFSGILGELLRPVTALTVALVELGVALGNGFAGG
jgi:Zn-dependent protease